MVINCNGRIPFEQGPIRPPSEACSLLVRVNRNCPWNRCTFCPVYKGQAFSKRTTDEILTDLRGMKKVMDDLSPDLIGADAKEARRVLCEHRTARGSLDPAIRYLLPWMVNGQETAFLQDADALATPTDHLLAVIDGIRSCFPTIRRITTYGRCQTLMHRTVDELAALRDAGLSRIHMGLESGSDQVLAYISKGTTQERLLEAGRRVKAAGVSLCEYVMPGLGGKRWSADHARDTAAVLAATEPDFVRLRSLAVVPGTPLAAARDAGDFELLDEVEVIEEIRILLKGLEGVHTYVVSDHDLNLLPELEGRLPEDHASVVAVVDRFLSLPEEERRLFVAGRRFGYVRCLDDLAVPELRSFLETLLGHLDTGDSDAFDGAIKDLASSLV